jgi:hypothetical protein
MRKQLEEMGKELREVMIYQSPPELGALYTEVSEMMEQMGAEQQVLIAKQMREEAATEKRRKQLLDLYIVEVGIGIGSIVVAATIGLALALVVQDRIEKYPHLGDGWIPKTEAQRKKEAEPKVWTGR